MDESDRRYSTAGGGPPQPPEKVDQHFEQIARTAPQPTVASGLAQAFHSDQTPDFGQMVSRLFGQSNDQQRSGLLNRLLAYVARAALSQVARMSGVSNLPAVGQITPQQAMQVPPEAVQQLATHVEKKNPSIVDEVSGFYAQHPDVVKALGGIAMAIAIQHIARHEH